MISRALPPKAKRLKRQKGLKRLITQKGWKGQQRQNSEKLKWQNGSKRLPKAKEASKVKGWIYKILNISKIESQEKKLQNDMKTYRQS